MGGVSPALFQAGAEEALFVAWQTAAAQVASAAGEGRYGDALAALAALRPAVDRYFDDVLVMAEDEKVKQNRLALVGQIAHLSRGLADLSKLEGF